MIFHEKPFIHSIIVATSQLNWTELLHAVTCTADGIKLLLRKLVFLFPISIFYNIRSFCFTVISLLSVWWLLGDRIPHKAIYLHRPLVDTLTRFHVCSDIFDIYKTYHHAMTVHFILKNHCVWNKTDTIYLAITRKETNHGNLNIILNHRTQKNSLKKRQAFLTETA
jgi:hypothetical protein